MSRERFSLDAWTDQPACINAGRDNAPKDYLRRSVLADMLHDAVRNPDRVIFWLLVVSTALYFAWKGGV